MYDNKIEVESFHQFKNLLDSFVIPLIEAQFLVFLLGKFRNVWINVELFTMIELLLLFLFDPMINWTNFCVFLNDGSVNVMIDFCDLMLGILQFDLKCTCLAPSTIFIGNMPLVKLSTSLSVT